VHSPNSSTSSNASPSDPEDGSRWRLVDSDRHFGDSPDLSNAGGGSEPELASLLNEALESKRAARERLLRAIRLQHPEAARIVPTQVPVTGAVECGTAPTQEPLSAFILAKLSECGSPLAL
jgi:hypothetical protein